jgi:hypothetical protein
MTYFQKSESDTTTRRRYSELIDFDSSVAIPTQIAEDAPNLVQEGSSTTLKMPTCLRNVWSSHKFHHM